MISPLTTPQTSPAVILPLETAFQLSWTSKYKLLSNPGFPAQVLFFRAPKSLQMVIAAMKLKDTWSLEGKLWPT